MQGLLMGISHAEELAQRKQWLLVRSDQLRQGFKQNLQQLALPLAKLDSTVQGLRWLAAHPLLPLGALVSVFLLSPRKTAGWIPRILWGWTMYRKAKDWLSLLRPG